MPLNETQLNTISSGIHDTVVQTLQAGFANEVEQLTVAIASNFTFAAAVKILQSEITQINNVIGSREIKEEVRNDWIRLKKHLADGTIISPELQQRLCNYLPNYNPVNVAYMVQYEKNLNDPKYAQVKNNLIRLREASLGMTPFGDYQYSEEYNRFHFRIGTYPFNLNNMGGDLLPGEVEAEIRRQISTDLDTFNSAQQSSSEEKQHQRVISIAPSPENERIPLLPNEGRAQTECSNRTRYGIAFALAVGAPGVGYGLYKMFAHNHSGSNPGCVTPFHPLTYGVTTPWQYGGEICFNNNQNAPINIGQFQFTNNVKIPAANQTWGDLIPWGSTFNRTETPDYGYTYLITPPAPGVTIPANGQLCAQYNYAPETSGQLQDVPALPPQGWGVWANGQQIPLEGEELAACAINPVPHYRLGTFVTSWSYYQDKALLTAPFMQRVNEVHYAFVGVNATTGQIYSLDAYADGFFLTDLQKQKRARGNSLNVTLAVGGADSNALFTQIAGNATATAIFANGIASAVKQYGFDGAMIDWEWYGAQSVNGSQFVQLHQILAAALKQNNKFLVTAVPAGVDKINQVTHEEWRAVSQVVDAAYAMTYDYFNFMGGSSNDAARLAPDPRDPSNSDPILSLYSVKGTLATYREMNCFADKQLIVGLPAYGRAVTVSGMNSTYGYYQPVTAIPKGQFDGQGQSTGLFNYRCIINGTDCQNGIGLPNGAMLMPAAVNPYGNVTKGASGYSPNGTFFISYDDQDSVRAKAQYVIQNNLGGAFSWEASGDTQEANTSLIEGTYRELINTTQPAPAKINEVKSETPAPLFSLSSMASAAKKLRNLGDLVAKKVWGGPDYEKSPEAVSALQKLAELDQTTNAGLADKFKTMLMMCRDDMHGYFLAESLLTSINRNGKKSSTKQSELLSNKLDAMEDDLKNPGRFLTDAMDALNKFNSPMQFHAPSDGGRDTFIGNGVPPLPSVQQFRLG
jgi:GH18 family chitinase